MSILLAIALAAAPAPTPTAASPVQPGTHGEQAPNAEAEKFNQAFNLIDQGHPADAVKLLDELITDFEARYAHATKQIYCARSDAETLFYAMKAAAAKKEAQVLDDTWCNSYFFKGYALIDLGKPDEAKPYFDKAIAMGPMNSHFLGERAEWYKSRRDWDDAYAEFSTASEAAQFSPDDMKSFDQRRAWRGMAYVRIEQRKLDEAEALLRKCVELDPTDEKANSELKYIDSLRHPGT
jgi:tetratricopeptide (TPR) repeat protein